MNASIRDSELPSIQKALAVFDEHAGVLRMSDAIRHGIHRRTLYALRDEGIVEQLSRGLYRLSSAPPLGNPDLVTVAMKVPKGVVCLISALAYYDLTTQIPHEVYVAIPRNSEPPRLDYPPIRSFFFGGKSYSEGIETHHLDGITVRMYGREKTLADCFKYRNKIGLDTALEALRRYFRQRSTSVDVLLHYASICRVKTVMRPYMEALL